MPLHDGQPAVVLLGPRGRPEGRPLPLSLGAGDAQLLLDALRGGAAQARLLSRIGCAVAALGRGLVLRPLPAEGNAMAPARGGGPTSGAWDLAVEAGQALAAAVRLGVPLLGDQRLFAAEAPERPRLVAFLEARTPGPEQ